ncbi:MAG: hypothetical protein M1818_004552 [Claussenomyces sp. TS43310]|nr:MAG: hypothetical protein M1818_004552 [Claussenomyces sp. TS43310]
MNSSLPSYEDECPKAHVTKSHHLELAYQETLRDFERVVQDESARRLRLQILFLEDSNDELQEQVTSEDDQIGLLEEERTSLQSDLKQAQIGLRRYEVDLQTQTRELNNLRAELASMNGITTDSTKLLTEKLALARELATLKPELDHLRFQATSQQTLLAEKLALQRQVTTLEVELETERRSTERVTQRGGGNGMDRELQTQIDHLERELAKEKGEREKEQELACKNASEWESCKAVLESKLEQMRMKLRTTKTQLKEAQADLTESQAKIVRLSTASLKNEAPALNSRKRSAAQISVDSTIGTPDGVAIRGRRGAATRGKIDQTLLGEKSMFSITPLLNRTIGVVQETPEVVPQLDLIDEKVQSKDTMEESEPMDAPEENPRSSPATNDIMRDERKTKDKHVLKETKKSAVNAKAGPRRQRTVEKLEKVTEETDENLRSLSSTVAEKTADPIAKKSLRASSEVVELKKKKRKLLGAPKTLFDEEEGETSKRPAKVKLGPPKPLGSVALGGPKTRLAAVQGSGFGGFSPLKKDRRGAQASFLA